MYAESGNVITIKRVPLRELLWVSFALVLVAAFVAPAAAKKTDVIILENGDHITGEIKKLERGQLKYSTDDMGTVYIEWEHLIAIWSNHQHRIRLEDGTFYYGSLAQPSESLTVAVVTEWDTIPLERDDVVGITPVMQSFWSRMDGSLSLGFNYTQATDIGQLAFTYKNIYQAYRNYVELNWKLNFTGQQEQDISRYQDFSLTYERETGRKRWFVAGSLGFEQNDELGIALRVPATVGGGKRIIQTNHVVWPALLGLSVNAEKATSSDSVTINLEGLVNTSFQFFRYDSPKSDITTNVSLFPSISNLGRFRLNFDITLQHELISDFFVDLTFWDNYDTDPPSENAQKNDWAITTSIGWKY